MSVKPDRPLFSQTADGAGFSSRRLALKNKFLSLERVNRVTYPIISSYKLISNASAAHEAYVAKGNSMDSTEDENEGHLDSKFAATCTHQQGKNYPNRQIAIIISAIP